MEQLTVEQLEEQKRNIEAQIASVRETQKQQAIALIKDMVTANNITRADLAFVFGSNEVAARTTRKVRKECVVKYRDENGNEWVGIGKMPKWLQEKIASGFTKEQFAV